MKTSSPYVAQRNTGLRGNKRPGFRAAPSVPMGFPVYYASPGLFAAFRQLRPERKTRYGWVADPYRTGTFTLHKIPSLYRRDNVRVQLTTHPTTLGYTQPPMARVYWNDSSDEMMPRLFPVDSGGLY